MLMEPSQRPSRIVLTLKEILRGIKEAAESEKDDMQLETLITALQSMTKAVAALEGVNKQIDERMKEVERAERLIEIQTLIIGGERKLLLVEAHRRYIREGVFEVSTSEKGNKIDVNNVYLFNDVLLLTQPSYVGLKFGLELKKKVA
mmetsp:Transcript_3066/g.5927  ORF Transcript_3066/g.5927 Transcript_3066/m.5927 type:complete len:147 (-) Transcript_3066:571-1011(-)